MKDSILVLFTCFNRKKITGRAVRQLSSQYKNISFLIVDDGSTDGTDKILQKRKNVEMIKTKGNCYYTASMRYGMDYLKKSKKTYDYLLLINDDVNFYDGILEKMIAFSKEKNGVVVGATVDDQENVSYGGILFRTPGTSHFLRVGPEFQEELDTCNGNCVLIPYSYFLNTDIMDKHYSHGFGDFDYGLALKRNGYSLYMFPEFIGKCNRNSLEGTYHDKKLSLFKRLQLKRKPKGLPFKEYFHYNYKNFGFQVAVRMTIWTYKDMIRK